MPIIPTLGSRGRKIASWGPNQGYIERLSWKTQKKKEEKKEGGEGKGKEEGKQEEYEWEGKGRKGREERTDNWEGEYMCLLAGLGCQKHLNVVNCELHLYLSICF
jgi:hypothetical protein